MSTPRFGDRVRLRLAAAPIYYGWIVVAACFVGAMTTFATVFSFGVFFGFIVDTFGQSYGNTSLVFSLQSIVTFGGGAALGFFIDRHGTRRLLALGAVLLGLGLLAASASPSFVGVVVGYGVVAAAGLSFVYVISYATAARWFEQRRAFATAVATSGGGAGILVGPPLASALIDWLGWQRAYVALSILFVSVLLLAAFLIDDNPDAMGLDTGDEFATADGASAQVAASWREQLAEVATVARSAAFALAFLGYLFIGVPLFIPPAHMVEFTTSAGIGREVGVLAVSVIGGMNIVGKFLVGPVADRIGSPRALAACSVLLGVTTLLWAVVRTPSTVLAVTVVFGIGYGGAIALLSPLLVELFGTGNLNALFGLTSVSFALTGAVVPYLTGVGFDVFGSYVPALVAAGIIGLLASGVLDISHRLASSG